MSTVKTVKTTASLQDIHNTGSQRPEKPENGIKGLKHWKSDILAGFMVAMISTPFSIGIAVASGAPPITGLTSAIIAGFILPFLGGSYVTISGPAAGLAPILYAASFSLGGGDLKTGYPLLLPVIMLAGLMQLVLSKLKAARFSAIFPVPVVEGMLAAIGLMIIAKQLPTMLGHKFLAHEFWGIILETPQEFLAANYTVLSLGVGTLALLFLISGLAGKTRLVKLLSPQLFAVTIGTIVACTFLNIGSAYFINIPENPLAHGLTLPDFEGLFASSHLWTTALSIAITLTLVDGIESLATINAIDKIDSYHRKSDPDKTLYAMGISNIFSSLAGGLTIIPGGVKSTANIMAGGKTQWANFYNACFLLMFLLLFNQQISLLPLAVLSAVLVYTGYKLCKPQVWMRVLKAGSEQFALFTFTVLLTLTTDLMWGIIGGVIFTFLINTVMLWKAKNATSGKSKSYFQLLINLFKNPVSSAKQEGGTYHIEMNRPLVCFNYLYLLQEFKRIPVNIHQVTIHITEGVLMIDHSIMDNLTYWMMQYKAETNCNVELVGLNKMRKLAQSEQSTHIMEADFEQATLVG